MVYVRRLLRISKRTFLALIFFLISSACLYLIYVAPGIANTLLYVVQARGIVLRDNVRTIEQMMRLYINKNTTFNWTNDPAGRRSSGYLMQPTTYLPENFTYSQNLPCPQRLPSMKGHRDVNVAEISMEETEVSFTKFADMEFGGHWKPKDCIPRWKVAILIPFRNRHEHLPILLQHLIPMLLRQRLEFGFYVIEQSGSQPFNRAMLFNIGFLEAMKDLDWDCLIFHDVDHIPENDRNYYGCGQMPRHFSAKLDKYMYILPYNEFFGGVSGLTVEQFRRINGFPNTFWGWGGEDDDLWKRVHYAGLKVTRPEGDIGKYKSIPHHHRGEVQFLGRYKLLRYSKERQYLDGLNNLHYSPRVSLRRLYKNITVDLHPELVPMKSNLNLLSMLLNIA
ncbi:beta-1,4-galactosyltransferase 6-like [Takifugu flavidus]|uniref:Beta-1,4-galactosyltransferase n=1 Tax=Takifugu flavidus TaxID=433684 RepID=A0A5C6NG04_9TELE|nr:beta-1,4-galactosyltransferase 6-like [Takifugu flavidus]TWW65589.1 Beta-1,4-galactosyltransferase 6 [Takifugu flavidus]